MLICSIRHTTGAEQGERTITVTAKTGSRKSLQDPLVELLGDVRVEFKGANEDALLSTDNLLVDLENGIVTTEAPVVFRINRQGAENVITGRNAQFDVIAQTFRVKEEVKLALTGAPGLLTASQARGQKPEGEKVLVTCEGGLLYEGMLQRTTLMKNVRAISGEDMLRADEMEVYFDPEGQSVRKTVARGNAVFGGPMGKASADEFMQSAAGDILLTGIPRCYFEGGTYRIESARLEINPRLGTISVPGPGSLEGIVAPDLPSGEGSSNAEEVKVNWEGGFLFDQKSHLAIIKQDVVALWQGSKWKCQSLVLRFSDDNRDIKRLDASEDLDITLQLPGANEKPRAEGRSE